ncbi:hypothetical protein GCM10019059_13790 [Camelimonas fluminis]|nr:hypothetical protein GCM10019059_13790 [Camelimonas fluminis]
MRISFRIPAYGAIRNGGPSGGDRRNTLLAPSAGTDPIWVLLAGNTRGNKFFLSARKSCFSGLPAPDPIRMRQRHPENAGNAPDWMLARQGMWAALTDIARPGMGASPWNAQVSAPCMAAGKRRFTIARSGAGKEHCLPALTRPGEIQFHSGRCSPRLPPKGEDP